MTVRLDKTGILSLFNDGKRCESEILADLEHIANSLTDLEFFTMLSDIYQTEKEISKHLDKIVRFLKTSYEHLERYQKNQEVTYLKQQLDGRYTINVGSVFDSGYDNWFSTEILNEKEARECFNIFKEIWFDNSIDSITKLDKLSDVDIYQLDNSEIQYYF